MQFPEQDVPKNAASCHAARLPVPVETTSAFEYESGPGSHAGRRFRHTTSNANFLAHLSMQYASAEAAKLMRADRRRQAASAYAEQNGNRTGYKSSGFNLLV